MKPGGFAVITTPNVDGFQARLFGTGWRSAIADHLVLFSRRTLGRVLRDSGFSIIKTVTWGGLAVGTAPLLIKKPVDRLAKRLGFGDVVLFLTEKRAGLNLCAERDSHWPASRQHTSMIVPESGKNTPPR